MKETHFLPFFCACRHPTNCQGRKAKICGVSGSGDESLASKRRTKCTQKHPCPEMHGFCNFAVFVDEKSRAPEHVKRDPHVFDLVLFLHPKKCLTCGRDQIRVVSGIFASFSRALEPWAVQNIQKGKKVVEAKRSSNRNVQKDVEQQVRKPSLARGDCPARVPKPRY